VQTLIPSQIKTESVAPHLFFTILRPKAAKHAKLIANLVPRAHLSVTAVMKEHISTTKYAYHAYQDANRVKMENLVLAVSQSL
jgi:hypothetical protein